MGFNVTERLVIYADISGKHVTTITCKKHKEFSEQKRAY